MCTPWTSSRSPLATCENDAMVDPDAASGAVVAQDPRIERSRRVILEAVLEELGEVGYGALTIEGVAHRAGVGKATIYRHWPGKLALVEDAFRTLKAPVVVPEAGTLRDRVVGMLEQVAGLVQESTYAACMPALIEAAERDPQVRDFHCRFSAERRAVLVDLLRDAVEDGELPARADPEFLADALVGSIFLRRLLLHEPLDPALVPALVDQLLPQPPARAATRSTRAR
jgi:TetR/AcrR family transcriptional regulator, regulator of autoinduction and epiphytic fitness